MDGNIVYSRVRFWHGKVNENFRQELLVAINDVPAGVSVDTEAIKNKMLQILQSEYPGAYIIVEDVSIMDFLADVEIPFTHLGDADKVEDAANVDDKTNSA